MQDSLQPENVAHVFVTVAGGVAYVAQAPENTRVHIIDFDDLGSDFETAFGKFSPEEKAFYFAMEEKQRRLAD